MFYLSFSLIRRWYFIGSTANPFSPGFNPDLCQWLRSRLCCLDSFRPSCLCFEFPEAWLKYWLILIIVVGDQGVLVACFGRQPCLFWSPHVPTHGVYGHLLTWSLSRYLPGGTFTNHGHLSKNMPFQREHVLRMANWRMCSIGFWSSKSRSVPVKCI